MQLAGSAEAVILRPFFAVIRPLGDCQEEAGGAELVILANLGNGSSRYDAVFVLSALWPTSRLRSCYVTHDAITLSTGLQQFYPQGYY